MLSPGRDNLTPRHFLNFCETLSKGTHRGDPSPTAALISQATVLPASLRQRHGPGSQPQRLSPSRNLSCLAVDLCVTLSASSLGTTTNLRACFALGVLFGWFLDGTSHAVKTPSQIRPVPVLCQLKCRTDGRDRPSVTQEVCISTRRTHISIARTGAS